MAAETETDWHVMLTQITGHELFLKNALFPLKKKSISVCLKFNISVCGKCILEDYRLHHFNV